MAKDKDRPEDEVLSTRNAEEEDQGDQEDDQEAPDRMIGSGPETSDVEQKVQKQVGPQDDDLQSLGSRVYEQAERIAGLEEAIGNLANIVLKLRAKKKVSGDPTALMGMLRALAGMALSVDGQAAFKSMCPDLYEE